MRFLQIIHSLDLRDGGMVEGLRQQIACLAELGHSTDVVTMDTPDAPWATAHPFTVYPLGDASKARQPASFIPWRRYGKAPLLIPWLKQHASSYDAVIVNGLWNYCAYASWRALHGSVPYFVIPHGMLAHWFRKAYPLKHLMKQVYWALSEGRLLRDAACVLFTSVEEMQQAQTAFFGYSFKSRLMAFGTRDVVGDKNAQERAFRDRIPQLGERAYLLFLARIHPKKGCDIVLNVFASIAAAYPDLDLVMAGPDQIGWAADLRKRARDLNVETRVHWPGMLEGDVKWGAIRGASAFVLPSHQENFGVAVAEAMAAEVPVLMSDKVAIWQDVLDSGGGFVSDDSSEAFSAIVQQFLKLPRDKRLDMGARARAGFLQKFEIHVAANDLVRIVRESVPAPGATRDLIHASTI